MIKVDSDAFDAEALHASIRALRKHAIKPNDDGYFEVRLSEAAWDSFVTDGTLSDLWFHICGGTPAKKDVVEYFKNHEYVIVYGAKVYNPRWVFKVTDKTPLGELIDHVDRHYRELTVVDFTGVDRSPATIWVSHKGKYRHIQVYTDGE